MPATTHDWLRIGHTLLRFRGDEAPGPGEALVDLEPAGAAGPAWLEHGGLLGVQAMSPLAIVPPRELAGAAFLGGGPGAALPALCARAYGFGRVVVLLPEEEQAAFAAAARATPGAGPAEALAPDAPLPETPDFFRVALGCGGRVPPREELERWVRRVSPGGQILLYALPAAGLERTFADWSQDGLALRACGFAGEEAFLAGSHDLPGVLTLP